MVMTPALQLEKLMTQPGLEQELDPVYQFLRLTNWDVSLVPVAQIPIEAIQVSRNGHSEFSNLDGLTASIQARGVLEPLIISPERRLLAGRRRLEAARRAGLTMVPVRVCEIVDERMAIEIGLVENVDRADPDPLTRAQTYRSLIELGETVEQIARLVGQGIGHVYQHLALLDLHPDVQQALHTRTLSFADARALVPLDLEDQAVVFQEIRSSPKPLSSRQVKLRVDARRVMRLVRKDNPGTQTQGETLACDSQNFDSEASKIEGNYAALFETKDATTSRAQPSSDVEPLNQLNTLIAEMVSAAQGEDQIRAWARRLSRILEELQSIKTDATNKKKSAGVVQDRLL